MSTYLEIALTTKFKFKTVSLLVIKMYKVSLLLF